MFLFSRIVETDSPLTYNRGGRVKRLQFVMPEASAPTDKDTYFAPTVSKTTRGTLKTSGADPGVVRLIDWHDETYDIYIDFMETRKDWRRHGIATTLMDELYKRHPHREINWGRVMSDHAERMFHKKQKEQPGRQRAKIF